MHAASLSLLKKAHAWSPGALPDTVFSNVLRKCASSICMWVQGLDGAVVGCGKGKWSHKWRYISHGSELGPILFTLYLSSGGNIIRQHGIHFYFYADENQLCLSTKPEEMEKWVKLQDINSWMTSNFLLLLNSDKTGQFVQLLNFSGIN